jgi:precorrin-2 dehydrogenase/sirohydrochlorin ferrochelatase
MPAPLLPLFLKLEGRASLVVGAGVIAAGKIAGLVEAGARVMVVAPGAVEEVRTLAAEGKIQWQAREFREGDLAGVFLVIVATGDAGVNSAVFAEAQARGILCNAVDDPLNCDFYFPAVVRRGDLQIAISTSGQSPALAQRIRRELEETFDESVSERVRVLGELRRKIMAAEPASEERKQALVDLAYGEEFDFSFRRAGKRHLENEA